MVAQIADQVPNVVLEDSYLSGYMQCSDAELPFDFVRQRSISFL